MNKTGIKFGNVELSNFVTVASGPLTDKLSKMIAAEEAGAGAVSLKLTFLKVPFQSQMRSYSKPGSVIISPTNKRLDLEKALEILKEAEGKLLNTTMFANYSGVGNKLDEWAIQSEALAKAGVDILEPNFCCPNLDTSNPLSETKSDHGGASIGENPDVCEKILNKIKSVTDIPIVPKIIPGDRHTLISVAKTLEKCGAAGIHIVGNPTSGLPPVSEDGVPEIPLIKGIPQGSTNGSVCKYTSFLYTAILAQAVDVPIMVSGGLETWKDCVDAISWGATAPSICSAFMWYGYEILDSINDGIRDFMTRNGFSSIEDFRGRALNHFTTPDKVELVEDCASVIDQDICIQCGRCIKPAHCEAISRQEDGSVIVDKEECIGCGVCQNLCPVGAITYK
jgi:dihydropyrimidine dehydrogenase (NAD+) subunit PreA